MQNIDNQSVCNSQIANNAPRRCLDCEYLRGHVEHAVDYCSHPSYGYMSPIVENLEDILPSCPLKQLSSNP